MSDTAQSSENITKTAWILSLGGFIPFFIVAILLLVLGSDNGLFNSFLDVFKIWSAVILSFLGGIRWGVAIVGQPVDQRDMSLSTVLPILGWLAILLPDTYSVMVLLLLFCVHGTWDSFSANSGKLPQWFGKIRITLTFLVTAAHLIVVWAADGKVLNVLSCLVLEISHKVEIFVILFDVFLCNSSYP